MTLRTRLDPVVKLREREEKSSREHLARATAEAQSAFARVTQTQASVNRDERRSADVAEWAMLDAAHCQARTELHRAQAKLESATVNVGAARAAHTTAHSRAEAVRRAAEARRAEHQQEQARAESRELDEVGSLLHWRKTE